MGSDKRQRALDACESAISDLIDQSDLPGRRQALAVIENHLRRLRGLEETPPPPLVQAPRT